MIYQKHKIIYIINIYIYIVSSHGYLHRKKSPLCSNPWWLLATSWWCLSRFRWSEDHVSTIPFDTLVCLIRLIINSPCFPMVALDFFQKYNHPGTFRRVYFGINLILVMVQMAYIYMFFVPPNGCPWRFMILTFGNYTIYGFLPGASSSLY